MARKYSPQTAYMLVDDIINECFVAELKEIFIKTGMLAHEYISYKHDVIEYDHTSYKEASLINLNKEALEEYYLLKKLSIQCKHMLRKMFLELPTHKEFEAALPLQSNEFEDSRSYEIFLKYKDTDPYKELEVRLLTSKVFK